jgi:RNA polymerase sigma-70 factor (ECF subfamily)
MARRLCRDDTRAQDLVQDTYVKALRFRSSFRPGSSMRAWLFSILRNTFLNEIKRDRRMDRYTRVEDAPQPAAPETSRDGLSDELVAALSALPEKQRMAVLLADVEEWSYEEIGRSLHCPKNTVGTLLLRARRTLRLDLEKRRG